MSAPNGYLTNPLYRDIAAMMTQAGIPHRVELGGRHWFVLFEIDGREYRQVLHLGSANKRSIVKKTMARFRKIVAMRGEVPATPQAVRDIGPARTDPAAPVEFSLGQLAMIDGEPRIGDLDLAARLGMADPHKIRPLIESHKEELALYGEVSARRAETSARGGRPGTERWLTEPQALALCALSRATNAPQVRAALIAVFMAWRRGQLAPSRNGGALDAGQIGGIVKAVVSKALADREIALVERIEALAARVDGLAPSGPTLSVAVDYVPSFVVVSEMARIGDGKRYRGLTSWATGRLVKFCAARGYPVKWLPTYPGERAAFPRSAAQEWLDDGGAEHIRARVQRHEDRCVGQSVLPFRGAR